MVNALLIVTGVVAGVLSGLVGIGGGIIIVPVLVLLFGFSQKNAQGTTIAMLVLPVGIFAATTYFKAGYVNVKAALLLAAGFVVGALIGAKYAIKLPEHTVVRIFGGVLLAVAVKLLLFGK